MCEKCKDGRMVAKDEYIARFTAGTRALFEMALTITDRSLVGETGEILGESLKTIAHIRSSTRTHGPEHLLVEHEALVRELLAIVSAEQVSTIFASGVGSASAH
jgi:hypothetical protein